MGPVAELRGVGQGYGRREVILDLDLDVRPGVLGLLGPNGAGKTTLLRTLATVVPPTRGTVWICGVPVESQRDAQRARRHIGYLPQHFGFYPASPYTTSSDIAHGFAACQIPPLMPQRTRPSPSSISPIGREPK